ncbi:chitinase-like protein [Fragilariopsis cylindrus CCMP1102]|uniref:Chitinase-like protein n=1 Tax=Fragilariopsis cylindrus CCMP1102 TaxID=635003 RepID=A0A1E7EP72_9STRA|nr:chitinase-like protein [Fragilariopsis cylindrus CCMP1102]|eukprot:OEU07772.1 chitinase-like protein [Fragilariopsis cylindrus CCMP1102]
MMEGNKNSSTTTTTTTVTTSVSTATAAAVVASSTERVIPRRRMRSSAVKKQPPASIMIKESSAIPVIETATTPSITSAPSDEQQQETTTTSPSSKKKKAKSKTSKKSSLSSNGGSGGGGSWQWDIPVVEVEGDDEDKVVDGNDESYTLLSPSKKKKSSNTSTSKKKTKNSVVLSPEEVYENLSKSPTKKSSKKKSSSKKFDNGNSSSNSDLTASIRDLVSSSETKEQEEPSSTTPTSSTKKTKKSSKSKKKSASSSSSSGLDLLSPSSGGERLSSPKKKKSSKKKSMDNNKEKKRSPIASAKSRWMTNPSYKELDNDDDNFDGISSSSSLKTDETLKNPMYDDKLSSSTGNMNMTMTMMTANNKNRRPSSLLDPPELPLPKVAVRPPSLLDPPESPRADATTSSAVVDASTTTTATTSVVDDIQISTISPWRTTSKPKVTASTASPSPSPSTTVVALAAKAVVAAAAEENKKKKKKLMMKKQQNNKIINKPTTGGSKRSLFGIATGLDFTENDEIPYWSNRSRSNRPDDSSSSDDDDNNNNNVVVVSSKPKVKEPEPELEPELEQPELEESFSDGIKRNPLISPWGGTPKTKVTEESSTTATATTASASASATATGTSNSSASASVSYSSLFPPPIDAGDKGRYGYPELNEIIDKNDDDTDQQNPIADGNKNNNYDDSSSSIVIGDGIHRNRLSSPWARKAKQSTATITTTATGSASCSSFLSPPIVTAGSGGKNDGGGDNNDDDDDANHKVRYGYPELNEIIDKNDDKNHQDTIGGGNNNNVGSSSILSVDGIQRNPLSSPWARKAKISTVNTATGPRSSLSASYSSFLSPPIDIGGSGNGGDANDRGRYVYPELKEIFTDDDDTHNRNKNNNNDSGVLGDGIQRNPLSSPWASKPKKSVKKPSSSSPWAEAKHKLKPTRNALLMMGSSPLDDDNIEQEKGVLIDGIKLRQVSPQSKSSPLSSRPILGVGRYMGTSLRSITSGDHSAVGGVDGIDASPVSPSATGTKKKKATNMSVLLPPMNVGEDYKNNADFDDDDDISIDALVDLSPSLASSIHSLSLTSSYQQQKEQQQVVDQAEIFERSVRDRLSLFGEPAGMMMSPPPQRKKKVASTSNTRRSFGYGVTSTKKGGLAGVVAVDMNASSPTIMSTNPSSFSSTNSDYFASAAAPTAANTTNVAALSGAAFESLLRTGSDHSSASLASNRGVKPQASSSYIGGIGPVTIGIAGSSSDLSNDSADGLLSVKDRTKVWGGARRRGGSVASGTNKNTGQHGGSRGGDESSLGTGGSLSVGDQELFLSKTTSSEEYDDITMSMHASAPILSVKDRMRSWTKSPATKSSSKKGGIIPRSSTRRLSLPTIDQMTEDESITDDHEGSLDSNAPSKARTWAVPSHVPAYANRRSSLKMVAPPAVDIQKQRQHASLGGSMASLPSLEWSNNSSSLYSTGNLRKVDPQNLRPVGAGDTTNGTEHSISSIKFPTTILAVGNADISSNDSQEVKSNLHDESLSERDDDHHMMESSSSLYLQKTLLRKVEPPRENKWKASRDDEINGSSHESLASSLYATAQLKKVEPSKEEKWKEPKNGDNNTAVLYSTQDLRPATYPIEDKWKEKEVIDSSETATEFELSESYDQGEMPTGETTGETKKDESKSVERPRDEDESGSELDVTDLQESSKSSGNKRLLMLVSTTSGRQEQKTAQDRALTILKGMRIDPQHLEQLDGADPDPNIRERRNELFAISGIRAQYPQFFLVDANEKVKFLCTWDSFELMHDMDSLSESMNLDTHLISSSSIQKQDDVEEEMVGGYVQDMESTLSSPGEAEVQDAQEVQDVISKENDVVVEAGSQDEAPAPASASEEVTGEEVTEDEVVHNTTQEEVSTPSIDEVKDDEPPSTIGEDDAKVVDDEENIQPDDDVINDADVRNEAPAALSQFNTEEVIIVKNIEGTIELEASLTDTDKVEDIIIPSSSPDGNVINEDQPMQIPKTVASICNEELQLDPIVDKSDTVVAVEEKEVHGDSNDIDNDNCNDAEGVTQISLDSFLETTPRKQIIDQDHDAKDDLHDNNGDGDEDDDDFRIDLALRKTSFNAVGNEPPLPLDRRTSMVSESGWSTDDDSNTIKSDYTDKSFGTIGSGAIVVDATSITSKEDAATKQLSKMAMAAAKINQKKDENKAKQQDIVFTPSISNETTNNGDNNNEEEDAQKSNGFKKKKKNKNKKKKSNSSSSSKKKKKKHN